MGVPDPWKSPRKPHKNQFVELKLRLQFFLHQKIFNRQNVCHTFEYFPPEPSQMDHTISSILNGLSLGASCFGHQYIFKRQFFTWFGGTNPQINLPKNPFLKAKFTN